MTDEDKVEESGDSLLARAHERRGFHLGVHEIMNEADTEYMQHYQRWLEFANIKERHLDRKTKQIVHVAVDIARNAHPDHIRAHMIAGVKAGVTEEEFFEVATLGFPPASLDPDEVLQSLPQAMQDAFDALDVAALVGREPDPRNARLLRGVRPRNHSREYLSGHER